MIPDFVRHDLERLDLVLPDGALERLSAYLDLVLEANQTTNLTAIRHRELAWSRLIVDSLTVLPGLEEGESVVDIGTGAGLPGVPLAVALPGARVTLVEATGKKARFLESVVSELGLDHTVVWQERIENVGQDRGDYAGRGAFDVAVSRAVGPMPVVLEYSLPLLRIGGRVLAMKGPRVEGELAESGDALDRLGGGEVAVIDAYPEGFDNELVIVSVVKERPTPRGYPRLPGVPKKEPL